MALQAPGGGAPVVARARSGFKGKLKTGWGKTKDGFNNFRNKLLNILNKPEPQQPEPQQPDPQQPDPQQPETQAAPEPPPKPPAHLLAQAQAEMTLASNIGSSQEDLRTCFMSEVVQPRHDFLRLAGSPDGEVYQFYSPMNKTLIVAKVAKLKDQPTRDAYAQEFKFLNLFEDTSKVVKAIHFDDGVKLDGPPIICMELLKERKRIEADTLASRRAVIDIAKVLAELMIQVHGKNVLHGDLKHDNLLEDANGRLKVAGFGHAMSLKDVKKKEKIPKGSPRFYAPEAIKASEPALWAGPNLLPGKPIDVYSYGLTLWELASRQEAYTTSDRDLTTSMKHTRALWGRVVGGERPKTDSVSKFGNDFCKLLDVCWEADSRKRPSFEQILNSLNNVKQH